MDLLKKQLDRVQQQIAGLSASQKMLTASLVAIMVMTFVWWGRYAGTAEMEPVVNQSLGAEEMQNVRRVLKAENIDFEASGDHILVPAEKKEEAIAALALENALPRDSAGSYEEIFNNMSPFTSPQMNDKISNKVLEQRLASVISKMHGVAEATVLIDPTHERLIGGNVEPKASVIVRMRNGAQYDKKFAEGIAEMVAGTNANMKRSRVSMNINGKSIPIHDQDSTVPDGEIDEQQTEIENRNADKIRRALRYCTGDVIVEVTAKVDTVASETKETTHPKLQTKDTRTQSETSTSTTPQPSSAEPGAAANTGGTLSTAQTAASSNAVTETEKTTSESVVIADEKVEHTTKPAGGGQVLTATVTVPRSYFLNILKTKTASAKDPDPADVEKEFEKQRPTILGSVMHAVNIVDEKQVTLDMYFDPPLLMAAGSTSTSEASASAVSLSLGGHVKEIAVGLLALLSLFMVSMMVKKSTPAPLVAAAIEVQEPISLAGDMDVVGEVSEGGQTLDGMELDEDAVKAQQMVEQVSTMVKENPDGAASMVKRWLNRS